MSGEQQYAVGTDFLDRLNRDDGERHDLDDVAREFGIDLNEPEP